MEIEKLLKLSILHQIKIQYQYDTILNDLRNHFMRGADPNIMYCVIPYSKFPKWIEENYDLNKLDNEYIPLLMEYLNDYALDNTEKSEENL